MSKRNLGDADNSGTVEETNPLLNGTNNTGVGLVVAAAEQVKDLAVRVGKQDHNTPAKDALLTSFLMFAFIFSREENDVNIASLPWGIKAAIPAGVFAVLMLYAAIDIAYFAVGFLSPEIRENRKNGAPKTIILSDIIDAYRSVRLGLPLNPTNVLPLGWLGVLIAELVNICSNHTLTVRLTGAVNSVWDALHTAQDEANTSAGSPLFFVPKKSENATNAHGASVVQNTNDARDEDHSSTHSSAA